MAIIGYIPPAAEPIPAVNAQPVPDNAPPAEAAVELPTAPATRLYVPLLTPSAGLPMYRAVLRLLRPALRLAA